MSTSTESPGLPRTVVVLIGVAAGIVVIAGMKASASIVGPTLLALILTIAVHPVHTWLRRKGAPTWVGATAALLLVYSVLLVLVVGLVLSVAQFAAALPTYKPKFDQLIAQGTTMLESFGVSQQQIQGALKVDANRIMSVVTPLLNSSVGMLSALTLIVTLLLFMAIDATSYDRRLEIVERLRPDVRQALTTFSRGTRTYLVVSTVFGLVVAVLDTAALWIIGVPLPIVWGLLSFITNYIPNIGFVIGLVPPALLALLEGGPVMAVIVIVVYSVINQVVQGFFQPKIVGDAVKLSITMTVLMLVFWGWVLGPLGALLAIPLTLLAKALLVDTDPSIRWLNVFVSNKAEDPDEPKTATAAA